MDRGRGEPDRLHLDRIPKLTPDQEAYLLRTRRNKMPYKHIAAQLRKTELACRLHYHQMSYGSNRRKRGASVSSLNSSASYTPASSVQDPSPGHTPYCSTPMTSPSTSPRSLPSQVSDSLASPPLYQGPQLPLLPKPLTLDGRPTLPRPSEWSNDFKVKTDLKLPSASEVLRSPPIDPSRLRDLYEAHRQTFWSQIANQYSPHAQVSASELETAFFTGHNVAGGQPPTPELSPKGPMSAFNPMLSAIEPHAFSGFNAVPCSKMIGSPPGMSRKCAVNELLNGPA